MAALTKDQILAALPKLSQADIAAIAAMATSLSAGRTAAPDKRGAAAGSAIFDALQAAVGATMPYETFMATRNGTKLHAQGIPHLELFLDKHFKGWNNNRVSQQAFLSFMFELLADDLKERGVTPTLGIMVVNLNRVHEVFENAFPGYIASGMGKLILKNFQ